MFRPGDLVQVMSDSEVGDGIRWFTRHKGEGKTRANHSGMMGTVEDLVEALARTVRHPLLEAIGPNETAWVWRYQYINQDQQERLGQRALETVGRLYAPFKLVLQAADGLLGKIFGRNIVCFRRLAFIRSMAICSQRVAQIYDDECGIRFMGLSPLHVTPDDISDHVSAPGSGWYCVATIVGGPNGPEVIEGRAA